MKRILLAGAVCFGFAGSATADDHMAANLSGLTSVEARCVVSTGEKYAQAMCGILNDKVEQKLSAAGIAYDYAGVFREGKEPSLAPSGETMRLEFLIRGTSGGNVGSTVTTRAGVVYEAAVEAGSDANPRSGTLVLWEKAAVAEGAKNKISAGLGNHMAGKLGEFLDSYVKAQAQ